MTEIGEKIKQRREELTKSQRALADDLGIAQSQLSLIERGKPTSLPVEKLEFICDYLQIEHTKRKLKDAKEGVTTEKETKAHPLVTKIEERNIKGQAVERPAHYENNGKDLFDELYDRLYHSKKMFTGREVFIIVMKFVAERYIRRYPKKNPEDLSKGIYCLQRLKEYEELEK